MPTFDESKLLTEEEQTFVLAIAALLDGMTHVNGMMHIKSIPPKGFDFDKRKRKLEAQEKGHIDLLSKYFSTEAMIELKRPKNKAKYEQLQRLLSKEGNPLRFRLEKREIEVNGNTEKVFIAVEAKKKGVGIGKGGAGFVKKAYLAQVIDDTKPVEEQLIHKEGVSGLVLVRKSVD